jgi:hypothetical protein
LALALVAQLAERFGLPCVDEPLATRIAVAMSMDWAHLIDTTSGKLKRYGPVDPQLRESLDPDLERLAQLALSIASLVETTQREEIPHESESAAGSD